MSLTRRLVIVASVAVLVFLAGCSDASQPGAAPAAGDWHTSVNEFANTSGPLALPADKPAGLQNVQALMLEGQPAATFYSPNEPMVTVCSGDVAKCRQALGTSTEIRTGSAGDLTYVIVLGQSEDLDRKPPLTPDAGHFWDKVKIVSAMPGWVSAPS